VSTTTALLLLLLLLLGIVVRRLLLLLRCRRGQCERRLLAPSRLRVSVAAHPGWHALLRLLHPSLVKAVGSVRLNACVLGGTRQYATVWGPQQAPRCHAA
jgi:hypothetical protein